MDNQSILHSELVRQHISVTLFIDDVIVPRWVVYESVVSGSVGLAQLTTADSRAG